MLGEELIKKMEKSSREHLLQGKTERERERIYERAEQLYLLGVDPGAHPALLVGAIR